MNTFYSMKGYTPRKQMVFKSKVILYGVLPISLIQLGVNGSLVLGVRENGPAAKVRTAVRLHTTLTAQFTAWRFQQMNNFYSFWVQHRCCTQNLDGTI
jgi:predicted secreted protein